MRQALKITLRCGHVIHYYGKGWPFAAYQCYPCAIDGGNFDGRTTRAVVALHAAPQRFTAELLARLDREAAARDFRGKPQATKARRGVA